MQWRIQEGVVQGHGPFGIQFSYFQAVFEEKLVEILGLTPRPLGLAPRLAHPGSAATALNHNLIAYK